MNRDQKTAAHIILIPAQMAVHSKVDEMLKNNGVGVFGRVLAQITLTGIGVAVHGAVESA